MFVPQCFLRSNFRWRKLPLDTDGKYLRGHLETWRVSRARHVRLRPRQREGCPHRPLRAHPEGHLETGSSQKRSSPFGQIGKQVQSKASRRPNTLHNRGSSLNDVTLLFCFFALHYSNAPENVASTSTSSYQFFFGHNSTLRVPEKITHFFNTYHSSLKTPTPT